MCVVEEITDSRGEEMTDKELIQLEEPEVSAKTEAEALEEPQEYLKLFTQTAHYSRYLAACTL